MSALVNYQTALLGVMYLLAAYERARLIPLSPELRPWYHISVAVCLVNAGLIAWLLIWGEAGVLLGPSQAWWLFIARSLQAVAIPVIYIWPAVIMRTIKIQQNRKLAELLGES